jgi:hypothetical protein
MNKDGFLEVDLGAHNGVLTFTSMEELETFIRTAATDAKVYHRLSRLPCMVDRQEPGAARCLRQLFR